MKKNKYIVPQSMVEMLEVEGKWMGDPLLGSPTAPEPAKDPIP